MRRRNLITTGAGPEAQARGFHLLKTNEADILGLPGIDRAGKMSGIA